MVFLNLIRTLRITKWNNNKLSGHFFYPSFIYNNVDKWLDTGPKVIPGKNGNFQT